MKKAFAFVLAVVVMMSLAVPAFAVASPEADKEDLRPLVVSTSPKEVRVYTTEEVAELSDEVQQQMAEAKKALKAVAPEGMAARYLLYVSTDKTCSVVFDLRGCTEVVFMQYVDGQWVELPFTINADGTITVEKIVEGPIVIFTKIVR